MDGVSDVTPAATSGVAAEEGPTAAKAPELVPVATGVVASTGSTVPGEPALVEAVELAPSGGT